MSEPVWLLKTAVLIAHEVSLSVHGGSAGIRDAGLLDSALARPRNLHEYGQPTIQDLAACYMEAIVNNHPFVDGNKRAGFLAGAAFLELNGFKLTASEPEATQMIMGLAAGEISQPDLAQWLVRCSVANKAD